MSVHHYDLRPLLALLATAACIVVGAVTGDPAFAAGSAAGAGSTGGANAPAGSGAAAGAKTAGSPSGGTGTQPSSGSQGSGSGASQAGKTAIADSAIATWYGPGFYGHKTACGQTLTSAVVGVANRTLPCGTLVKVSYDGRSKVVPVLDRGPYADNGASWDLTAGAATALEITEKVRISAVVVGSVPNSLALGSPSLTPGEADLGGAETG
jgi:rare lipoprotein A (peptidoglycan hydrolase)